MKTIQVGSLGEIDVIVRSKTIQGVGEDPKRKSFVALWGGTGGDKYAPLAVAGGPVRFSGTAYNDNDGLGWGPGRGGEDETLIHPDDRATEVQIDEASAAIITALNESLPIPGPETDNAVEEESRARVKGWRKEQGRLQGQIDRLEALIVGEEGTA